MNNFKKCTENTSKMYRNIVKWPRSPLKKSVRDVEENLHNFQSASLPILHFDSPKFPGSFITELLTSNNFIFVICFTREIQSLAKLTVKPIIIFFNQSASQVITRLCHTGHVTQLTSCVYVESWIWESNPAPWCWQLMALKITEPRQLLMPYCNYNSIFFLTINFIYYLIYLFNRSSYRHLFQ